MSMKLFPRILFDANNASADKFVRRGFRVIRTWCDQDDFSYLVVYGMEFVGARGGMSRSVEECISPEHLNRNGLCAFEWLNMYVILDRRGELDEMLTAPMDYRTTAVHLSPRDYTAVAKAQQLMATMTPEAMEAIRNSDYLEKFNAAVDRGLYGEITGISPLSRGDASPRRAPAPLPTIQKPRLELTEAPATPQPIPIRQLDL